MIDVKVSVLRRVKSDRGIVILGERLIRVWRMGSSLVYVQILKRSRVVASIVAGDSETLCRPCGRGVERGVTGEALPMTVSRYCTSRWSWWGRERSRREATNGEWTAEAKRLSLYTGTKARYGRHSRHTPVLGPRQLVYFDLSACTGIVVSI